ncbi:MAG: peptide ABC transporter substrate-binding protein [Waddliaceae bacterium]
MSKIIEVKQNLKLAGGASQSSHPFYDPVYQKLNQWVFRFPFSADQFIGDDLDLFFLLASKTYLDHRMANHLFRVILSLHFMQKKLLYKTNFSPHQRHVKVRWIPTQLIFPFSQKTVIGCLIGYNAVDRYEVFDEENAVLTLQKSLPHVQLVEKSAYSHPSQYANMRLFYFEIEKEDGASFSLAEQTLLKHLLKEKVKSSIQRLSPSIFMGLNNEEIYKNTIILSQEIQSLQDLPQASITLDQQTGKEVIFLVNLVQVCPLHRFSLKERFFDCRFESERVATVRHLDNHPIQAHIFRLCLPRHGSLLRSDGSLDFHTARQRVVSLTTNAIGEFRDYNGGILIKQREQLNGFKEHFGDIARQDSELMESFFYGLTPLEKQVILPQETLFKLFHYFMQSRQEILSNENDSFKTFYDSGKIFLVMYGGDASLKTAILSLLQKLSNKPADMAYNFIETAAGLFFNCVVLGNNKSTAETFIESLQHTLNKWRQKRKERQCLRIGVEYSVVSLDPRVGGESISGDMLKLLFEGLTRFNQKGQIENALAESIEVSSNLLDYTFQLRTAYWNDGSLLTAHDFEYAWKTVLSPDFDTAFIYFFYSIKHAKEAKEGKVSADQIGIHAIDERTLKVELTHPTPYFLQMTAHPLYSPVHRFVAQRHPQWSYQCGKNYPCNGPFQLKINQPGQGYQLVKNPFYWEANQIALDQITITHMTPTQAVRAFQRREVDWVGSPFGSWHPSYNEFKAARIGKVLALSNTWVCWCQINTSCFPFNYHKLRQAFAHAVQRGPIVSGAFLPITPAYSPLLPQHQTSSQLKYPDYDPEKALQLFHEALEEMNLTKEDLPPFRVIYIEHGIREHTASCLKKQFEECFGIDCELHPLPWNEVFHRLTHGEYQMSVVHWFSWLDDPIYTLNSFRSVDIQKVNFSRWESESLDYEHYLDQSERIMNPFQRSVYLVKAEETLIREIPIIPLFYQPGQALVKDDLKGIYRDPCGSFNITRIYHTKEN